MPIGIHNRQAKQECFWLPLLLSSYIGSAHGNCYRRKLGIPIQYHALRWQLLTSIIRTCHVQHGKFEKCQTFENCHKSIPTYLIEIASIRAVRGPLRLNASVLAVVSHLTHDILTTFYAAACLTPVLVAPWAPADRRILSTAFLLIACMHWSRVI